MKTYSCPHSCGLTKTDRAQMAQCGVQIFRWDQCSVGQDSDMIDVDKVL